MIQNLCIIHRRKPRVFSEAEAQGMPVWATCLRSLAFPRHAAEVETIRATDIEGAVNPHSHDEIYTKQEAYEFLLQVVCGLHSPILGETEVFGQFKIFMQAWLKERPEFTPLAQRILADAKAIRAKYLANLGNQSYGSWLRKNVKATEVHILGGGQLVREVLPYLNKQGKQVTLHVRDPRKIDFHTGKVETIYERGFNGGALVIAAPMSASEVEAWLGANHPSQIFDLRDNSCTDKLSRASEHHGLAKIFKEIEQNKIKLQPLIERVREEIAGLADKASQHTLVRPQGWDDLCA